MEGSARMSGVDLSRYHDLTQRLAAFDANGGAYLRGDRRDVRMVDGEPAMAPGEREVARLMGVLELIGSRTTVKSRSTATLGPVIEGGGPVAVTTHRLIVMAARGASQLGPLNGREVHTFVFPWDLVDLITLPLNSTIADRIAGGRTIELFSGLTGTMLKLMPLRQVEIGGRREARGETDILRILVDAAVRHRMTVSPESDHPRLQRLLNGRYSVEGGETVVEVSDQERDGALPVHLAGRLVASGQARARAATLLLLDRD
jgi:hypothetical protein